MVNRNLVKNMACLKNSLLAIQVMLQQSPKYLTHQRHMRRAGGRIDQDVIDVHYHSLPEQVSENLIYEGLEDGWSILQPIWHDAVLIMTRCSTKCSFPLISSPDTHQIIRTPQVQFGEEACP
jgi:hypothetical protein